MPWRLRLDDDGCNFLGREQAFEHLLFEQFQNLGAAGFRSVAVRATVGVGKRNVLDAAKQRAEILALRIFRSRK